MSTDLPPRQGLVAFMAKLAGPDPAGYLELRHRRPDRGMRQRFFDASQPNAAATAATCLAQTGDVYVGCTPRRIQAGDKQAVAGGWVLWVDCDDAQAIARLHGFSPQPAILVRSSERGCHAYWPLEKRLPAGELEQANRRLAHHLGACQSAVTNAAAILRPPATLNWKYQPPTPVALERLTDEHFQAEQVVRRLAEPPIAPRPNGAARPNPARSDDPLLDIAPAQYVATLTGQPVGRDGKAHCPFHPDQQASLHAYPQPTRGWACFSARCWQGDRPNAGDIYTLAGQLWGLSTHGPDFLELRRRLQELFQAGAPQPHAQAGETVDAH